MKTDEQERRRFCLFPKSLGTTLTQVVKPVYKKHGFAEHRILTEWHQIVGPELAAYSLPEKLSLGRGKKEGGTLHVLAAAGRALELQHMQPLILSRIAAYFGYVAVSRLLFTQTHTALFKKKAASPPPLTFAPDASLDALTAQCEDDALRHALISLGQALAAVEN